MRHVYHLKGLSRILLIFPGVAAYFILPFIFHKEATWMQITERLLVIYVTITSVIALNGILKTWNRPMKGLIQVVQVCSWFVGGIISIAVLLNRSPAAMLTGLGASAAVLMLIFKDSILGFVAGVQLAQNNMVRIGDWIQLPDGSANGTVEEITLNTVKVRNWDNTISTIPPYSLISSPFKNWRGMQESGGRRVDKRIFIDLTSIMFCTEDMVRDIVKRVPLMKGYSGSGTPTNVQLYRIYIERYLKSHLMVSQDLDLIIAQREPTQFGLPVEVYFFLKDKIWNEYETLQSDIFDHLLAMAREFGLSLYQLPSR